jgi:hypothetical protein
MMGVYPGGISGNFARCFASGAGLDQHRVDADDPAAPWTRGGLSDMFGGGVTSNLGSSGVAERNLNRITVIVALIWVSSIVTLGLFTRFDV